MIDWTEKYTPRKLSEVVGNPTAVAKLGNWARTWGKGKKAALLYGPSGVGKTSAAYAIASEMSWEVVELNASDVRTKAQIEKIAGAASMQSTLFGGSRLIVLDEVDNVHGTADRGGMTAIVEIVRKTAHPIILTANDSYELPRTLKDACLLLAFYPIDTRAVSAALRRICTAERIKCDAGTLDSLAETSGGDLRSAINDLEAVALGRNEIKAGDSKAGKRDTKEPIFEAIAGILKGHDMRGALSVVRELDETPEDFIHWLDENLPREYRGDDLRRGFDYLSKADIFLGRTRSRQQYSLWKYANELMVCGVQAAKTHEYVGDVKYNSPSLWYKTARGKSARKISDSIASKVAGATKTSQKDARNVVPFLENMCRCRPRQREVLISMAKWLALNADEVSFLSGLEKESKEVQSIMKSIGP